MNKELVKKILTYAGIILFFAVVAYSFVPQVLDGKIVNQSDIAGWKGMAQEAVAHNEAHPEDPTAWTNSMFGGMPTTAILMILTETGRKVYISPLCLESALQAIFS